jgi:hypothetical protein
MHPKAPLLAFALAVALARLLPAAVPDWQKQINYQGQLTDASRVAVADGAYSITFKIYDHPSSLAPANLVWSGETQSVNVSKGLFNAYLGQLNPLPALSPAQQANDFYLFVQVAGEATEMLPRQKLLPAFLARNALSLQGLYPDNTANNLAVLDSGGKLSVGLLFNAPFPAVASNGVNVTNECAACYGGIFANLTATGGSSGAALRVAGRIAAPDIINTFIASAGVTSQVVTCPYCKAGDEVFLQAKGDAGTNNRYWVSSVGNGSFTLGFSSGLSSAISMAYLVIGDF